MLGRVVLILNRPRPHNLCGVSCSQYPRWDITEDSRSRTDDCPLSDGDARADEYVRGYPRVLTYDNGSGNMTGLGLNNRIQVIPHSQRPMRLGQDIARR